MCGIAGILNIGQQAGAAGAAEDQRGNMQRMRDRMLHRGPDGGGTWVSPDGLCTLGHQRLSILDLSKNGAQPMVSHSGKTVLVYNGEIYNHADVRAQLERDLGRRGGRLSLRSTCDTEILQEAAEFYGVEKALQKCKGMFALASYDIERRVLTLARDRVGEKPLYYGWIRREVREAGIDCIGHGCEKGGSSVVFAFASDLGSLRSIRGFSNPIRREVLDLYFEHGVIPAPYSIYEDIYKLEPGTILTLPFPFDQEQKRQETYWSMTETAVRGQKNLFTGTRQEAADELERLLRASIRDQMVSDVPLGAFLSAGIDSATVVSLMQQESRGGQRVRTFTIGMEDPAYNEAAYAAQIARHLGTEHTELTITEEDAKAVIPLLPAMFAEPFADSSQIPTYLVSKLTREHVTVSLSGDAGDELFCGYYDYPATARKWDKIRNIPYALRRTAGSMLEHSPLASRDLLRIKSQILQARSPEEVYRLSFETDPLWNQIALCHGALPYAYTQTGEDVTGEVCHDIMLMDLRLYHPDDILVKVDRTAMAVSLETRVPFLDRDVVEFAWTLPLEYLREKDTGKLVLRDVLYRYVPREMMDRPKKGFSIPIRKWLREDPGLRGWAEELLDDTKIRRQGYLNAAVVRRIWEEFTESGIWRVQLWYILMFQAWLEMEEQNAAGGIRLTGRPADGIVSESE